MLKSRAQGAEAMAVAREGQLTMAEARLKEMEEKVALLIQQLYAHTYTHTRIHTCPSLDSRVPSEPKTWNRPRCLLLKSPPPLMHECRRLRPELPK